MYSLCKGLRVKVAMHVHSPIFQGQLIKLYHCKGCLKKSKKMSLNCKNLLLLCIVLHSFTPLSSTLLSSTLSLVLHSPQLYPPCFTFLSSSLLISTLLNSTLKISTFLSFTLLSSTLLSSHFLTSTFTVKITCRCVGQRKTPGKQVFK